MERDIAEIAIVAVVSFTYTLICWAALAVFDAHH